MQNLIERSMPLKSAESNEVGQPFDAVWESRYALNGRRGRERGHDDGAAGRHLVYLSALSELPGQVRGRPRSVAFWQDRQSNCSTGLRRDNLSRL